MNGSSVISTPHSAHFSPIEETSCIWRGGKPPPASWTDIAIPYVASAPCCAARGCDERPGRVEVSSSYLLPKTALAASTIGFSTLCGQNLYRSPPDDLRRAETVHGTKLVPTVLRVSHPLRDVKSVSPQHRKTNHEHRDVDGRSREAPGAVRA